MFVHRGGKLPFGNPGFDVNTDPPPLIEEFVEVEPLSLEYVTLFVVAPVNDAPVTVYAYDANSGDFISQLTVNGDIAAGDLIDPGTTDDPVSLVEIHDPGLIEPVWSELEILPLSENYENPNFRSPNYRSPNYRNTDYMDPNMRSADLENPNYRSTSKESTSLSNPNLRSPNLRSDSFVDLTYTVTSQNNTITAVNADFAYGGDDLDGDQVQVIAWKEDQLMTAQGCEDGFITENKVISAKANPNMRSLAPADIADPFQGTVSFPLEPGGGVNVTFRIFCNEAEGECSNLIEPDPDTGMSRVQDLLGYNFWSQKANTGATQITKGIEALTRDVIPPVFEPPLENGTTFVSEATGPDGAIVDIVNDQSITANDNGEPVDVTCQLFVAGQDPDTMPSLAPLGDSGAQCDTEPDSQGNVGTWSGFVLVEDNTAPVINVPGGSGATLTVAPTSSAGAAVDFLAPGAFNGDSITVTEAISPEAVTFACSHESGSVFPVGNTLVSCTASDAGPCDATNAACVDGVNVSDAVSFTIGVLDGDAPVINDGEQLPDFGPVEATALFTPVNLPLPTALDTVDNDPTFTNDAPPSGFPLGDTIVTWTVTDFSGNEATATQKVIVQDSTAPVITVPGDITQGTTSEDGLNVDFNVTATDIFDVTIACEANGSPVQSGDLFAQGDTTVICTATDSSGNLVSDQFTVTITIEYIGTGVSGKMSGKTGSSFPVQWSWQNESGENVRVGVENQRVTLREGICPGGALAQDPGNSGVREMSDGSYDMNIQAVDENGNNLPAERPSTPYCVKVTLLTNGQEQLGTINVRP